MRGANRTILASTGNAEVQPHISELHMIRGFLIGITAALSVFPGAAASSQNADMIKVNVENMARRKQEKIL